MTLDEDRPRLPRKELVIDGLLVACCAAIPLLLSLHARTLLVWDESLYCGATVDMAEHNAWLYPTEGGQFFEWYGKPPLINWLQAASTALLGWNVFALRLPTALGMVGLVFLVWATGVVLGGRRLGAVAAALVLMSRHMLSTGQQVWLEDLIAPLFAGAFLLYAHAREWPRLKQTLGLFSAGLLIGLAVLTKQTFGLFALAAIGGGELLLRSPRLVSRVALVTLGAVVSSAWWFIWTWLSVGQSALDSWFGYHVVERFSKVLEGHARPPNGFGASLDTYLGVLPWVLGALGFLLLWTHENKTTIQRRLIITWAALFVAQYVVVGIAVRTFLHWYQVVIIAPFFLGAAHLALSLWYTEKPRWLRWILPIAILTAAAGATRSDSIAVAAVVLVIAAVFDRRFMQRVRGYLGVRHLVIASGLVGLIIVNPLRRDDWRAATAARVSTAPVVVVADDPEVRVWRCYLPSARLVTWPGDCSSVNASLANEPLVALEGAARECHPSGYEAEWEHPKVKLWSRHSP